MPRQAGGPAAVHPMSYKVYPWASLDSIEWSQARWKSVMGKPGGLLLLSVPYDNLLRRLVVNH